MAIIDNFIMPSNDGIFLFGIFAKGEKQYEI